MNPRLVTPKVNAKVRGPSVNVRVSAFQTGILTQGSSSVVSIHQGQPIGLLLALTYANDIVTTGTSLTYRGDLRPNTRIR